MAKATMTDIVSQAAIVSVRGLFLYVARRVSGGVLVPILLHAGLDLSLFSSNLGEKPPDSTFVVCALVAGIVMAIIVLLRRKAVWPLQDPEDSKAAQADTA